MNQEKLKKNNLINFLIIFFVLCALFRIDFRFKEGVSCCSDDYDYYSHAETIAIDGDFDYSNQISTDHPFYYSFNGKIAPVGFPGSGMLASPFLFIGNLIDKLFIKDNSKTFFSYKLLFYSLAPVIYYFIGFFYILKSLIQLNLTFNKYFVFLIVTGSGLPYFAFERFSMTHVYEFFIISLLLFNSLNFYKSNRNISAFLVPLFLMFSILVRMSNLYVFFLPIICYKLLVRKHEIKNRMLKNYFFLFSTFLSFIIYIFLSFQIYGKIIINPQEVYGTQVTFNSISQNSESIFVFIFETFSNLLKVLFGNEFGIFWVSPIIFSGICTIVLLLRNKHNWLLCLFLIISYGQNLGIVAIWKSTAASYGFRYLYSLVPLSVLIVYEQISQNKNKFLHRYLLFMSIFSLISILFFETTTLTQLSMNEILNSFGEMRPYSQTKYVFGVILSTINLNSYLIIFTTSWLGVVFFKTLLTFFNQNTILKLLSSFGLPTDNKDFLVFLNNLELVSFNKIFIVIAILLFFSYFLTFKNLNLKIQ